MTKQTKDLARYLGLPAAIFLTGSILFYLLNTAFVSQRQFAPVRAEVDTLQQDMRELKADVRLGVCLQLAEKRGGSWQECVK